MKNEINKLKKEIKELKKNKDYLIEEIELYVKEKEEFQKKFDDFCEELKKRFKRGEENLLIKIPSVVLNYNKIIDEVKEKFKC